MVGVFLGLGWVLAAVLAVVLIDGGEDSERAAERPRAQAPLATPRPALTPPARPGKARAQPGDTRVQETDGSLAIGITEPNPNFLWAPGVRDPGPPFGQWRDELERMQPAYHRLVLDWPSMQPGRGARANFDLPNGGCMREITPCGAWSGVREQLRALASRQKRTGMEVLVVVTGSPSWAARPARGCERAGIEPRSRPPRTDALPAYRALIADTLAVAAQAGVDLRYWSAWNEPNHPYFMSPQRTACAASARSAAIGPYVELARALRTALDEAPGEQEYVLGELAGLTRSKARSTAIEEFARGLPRGLVCGARAWSQHGYVGGDDPVDPAADGLRSFGCPRAPEIWITETGVGAAKLDAERSSAGDVQRRACRAMHRRLKRWYEDPRVTAAFQYTLREDDRFPTGLVTTALDGAYPVLQAWQAWGARTDPAEPAPSLRAACRQRT